MLSAKVVEQRKGNFTASDNHSLMACWNDTRPDTSFEGYECIRSVLEPLYLKGQRLFRVGDIRPQCPDTKVSVDALNKTKQAIKYDHPSVGLISYAEEKAAEMIFDVDPDAGFSTVHTENGNEREEECVYLLSKKTGIDFSKTGDDQIHLSANEVGCTPDGVVYDELDLIVTGCEVKCKSPKVHAKNLLINTNKDLLERDIRHYTQIQTCMLVTGTDHWYFANYNPWAHEGYKFKSIVIKRDDFFISVLKQRLEVAKKIKHETLAKLYENAS